MPGPPAVPDISLDDVITSLGMGTWTWLYFAVAMLCPMTMIVNLVGGEFMAPPLDVTCADPLYDDLQLMNGTQCHLIRPGNESTEDQVLRCQRFDYDNSTYESTLTKEFGLVCSRAWLTEFFQMIYTIGCLVGTVFGGVLSDRYGRQPTVWYGAIAMSVATILLTAVPALSSVLAMRFFIGLFTMLMMSSAFTIGLEVCPMYLRSTYGVMSALPYAAMLSALAGIAYFSRRWRELQLWGSLPLFVTLLVSNPIVLQESPRWLVERGRLKKAEEVLERAARLNKAPFTFHADIGTVLLKIYQNQNGDALGSSQYLSSLGARFRSLFTSPEMRRITLSVALIGLFEGTLYISIPLRADAFSSPFLYIFLLGVAEVPAYTIAAPVTGKLGRRKFLICGFLLTGLMLAILLALNSTGHGSNLIIVLLSAIAFTFTCGVYQVSVMYYTELFPTSVRTMGTSVTYFMTSLGFSVPPILNVVLPACSPWIAHMIYITMAFVAAALVLLLPETNGQPLLETVDEYLQYSRRKRSGSLSSSSTVAVSVDGDTRESETDNNKPH